jgi:uncharacterized short protein YbdD (DUF466 family)
VNTAPKASDLPGRLRGALRVVRAIIGAPDYERYVAHMRERHPECQIATRDEFMRQRLESRYSKPGARCC